MTAVFNTPVAADVSWQLGRAHVFEAAHVVIGFAAGFTGSQQGVAVDHDEAAEVSPVVADGRGHPAGVVAAYHGKTTLEYTYKGRTTRAQKLEWNADGFPVPVMPVSLDTEIKLPSGDPGASR